MTIGESDIRDRPDPSPVRIQLFGGVSAGLGGDGEGEPLDIGPAKCRSILALLALSAGTAVPVPRIVEVVWGTEPPRTAEKTLQSYMTRLRKALGPDSIVRLGAAYRLDVDPENVDVNRFRSRLAAGDVAAALREWTGTPLAGVDAAGLSSTVDGLIEQWLGALEVDLERLVDADPAATIGTLTELTSDYPFREGLWALLMTALYRSDRQAEALAAYGTARHHLVEELGVEPGPRLRELEYSILGQDEQLGTHRSGMGNGVDIPSGTVTFGFYDIENEALLWADHRGEMAIAVRRFDEIVHASLGAHRGHAFGTDGEARGVAFHRAIDGLRWAADLQRAIADEAWPSQLPFALRIGIHTGEPEERRNGYFGPAVNVAAGLVGIGHGGQTLVSGVTAALLGGLGPQDGLADVLADLGTYRLDHVFADQRILQLGGGQFPPLRTVDGRRGNLPNQAGRLIGREESLLLVDRALAESSMVTLVGPGGIGKTRLALAVARRWAAEHLGEVWLIELAGIASSVEVARAVATALQIKEAPGQSVVETVVTHLAQRPALVVLDNCEHVIDGAADMAEAIAAGCSETSVLATSREGFGLRGEQLIAVTPLSPADAGVELFNERASAASHTFDPVTNLSDVEEICRRLDGVPLAIELAAARTTSLAPADLVDRLDDRLRLLTGGRRTTVERHRTLRATIQWSYDLLNKAEQLLFQRLSIFAGPFDLQAAERVAAEIADPSTVAADRQPAGDQDVDDLLGGLVDQSMVIVESGPFGRRFRLLETMRQFGAEHLSDAGHTDLVARRLAHWCRDQVQVIHELLSGQQEAQGVARLEELWGNLRAAIDWSCTTGDAQLAAELVRPVAAEIALRTNTEIGDWVERILDIADPADDELISFCLGWAAHRYMLSRDTASYEDLVARYGEPDHPLARHARAYVCDENEDLIATAPDAMEAHRGQSNDYVASLIEISSVIGPLLALGRFDEHDVLMEDKLLRLRSEGPPTLLHWALFCNGYSMLFQGRHDEAHRFLDEASRMDLPDRTMALNKPIEARAAVKRGDHARGFEILRTHVAELIETDNLVIGTLACSEFVNLMVEVGRIRDASLIIGFVEMNNVFSEIVIQTYVGDAMADRGEGSNSVSQEDRQRGSTLAPRDALAHIVEALSKIEAEVNAAAIDVG